MYTQVWESSGSQCLGWTPISSMQVDSLKSTQIFSNTMQNIAKYNAKHCPICRLPVWRQEAKYCHGIFTPQSRPLSCPYFSDNERSVQFLEVELQFYHVGFQFEEHLNVVTASSRPLSCPYSSSWPGHLCKNLHTIAIDIFQTSQSSSWTPFQSKHAKSTYWWEEYSV